MDPQQLQQNNNALNLTPAASSNVLHQQQRSSPTPSHGSVSKLSRLVGTGFAMAVKILHHSQGSRLENDHSKQTTLTSIDDLERSKLCQLAELVKCTKFTKNEIKRLYRDFKQEFPKGYADQEKLAGLFGRIFPHGNSESFATYIIKSINGQVDGTVLFYDFVHMLSTIMRGSLEEKIEWIFDFYTNQSNGNALDESSIFALLKATYELLGEQTHGHSLSDDEIRASASKFLRQIDPNGCGQVTKQQFIKALTEDSQLSDTLERFGAGIDISF